MAYHKNKKNKAKMVVYREKSISNPNEKDVNNKNSDNNKDKYKSNYRPKNIHKNENDKNLINLNPKPYQEYVNSNKSKI